MAGMLAMLLVPWKWFRYRKPALFLPLSYFYPIPSYSIYITPALLYMSLFQISHSQKATFFDLNFGMSLVKLVPDFSKKSF